MLFDSSAPYWKRFYKLNYYYHRDLQNLLKNLIPKDASVIELGCREGELLSLLPNKNKTGVEASVEMIKKAKKKNHNIKFIASDYEKIHLTDKYDYIILSNALAYIPDVESFIKKLSSISHPSTKIIIVYINLFWKPLIDLAEKIKLRFPQPTEPNWLDYEDIQNMLSLEGFDEIRKGSRFLIPYSIPLISDFINRFIAQIFIFNPFCFTKFIICRPPQKSVNYSTSIIVPARNEEGHIPGVLKKIPNFGEKTEVIFVENNSKDNTFQAIKKEADTYQGPLSVSYYSVNAKGKKEAVFFGFSKAKNDIVMILDSDLTVPPSELPKFYASLANGKAEFANGSRLVYPIENQAMRFFNYLGNKFFGMAFSWLLNQRIKDTLCGTKALFKKDLEVIIKNASYFGKNDPFGDFDLLFGASKFNLKIKEIPIRYKARQYGTTNISRFKHGLLLLKMTIVAANKINFI